MARPRIHTLHQDYFDSINTERKAYWLGFLAADGCVTERAVLLTLAIKDIEHVRRFAADLGASYPISADHRKASIALCSVRLSAAMTALGFGPRKSHRLAFPSVSDAYINHFVRGLFDGDGCVHVGRKVRCVTIVTAFRMAYALQKILNANGITSARTRPHYQSEFTRVVWISRVPDVCTFREWIYEGATVWLPRKRAIFDSITAIPDRACVRCGTTFTPRYSNKGDYCSSKCYMQTYYASNKETKWKENGVWKH